MFSSRTGQHVCEYGYLPNIERMIVDILCSRGRAARLATSRIAGQRVIRRQTFDTHPFRPHVTPDIVEIWPMLAHKCASDLALPSFCLALTEKGLLLGNKPWQEESPGLEMAGGVRTAQQYLHINIA